MRTGGESTKKLGTYVALLRGLNVGGRNKLAMKDLIAVFAEAGCRDVRTYIQSGNVVFRATPALARRLPALVEQTLLGRLAVRTPVVTRTASELRRIVESNPFHGATAYPKTLHVAFLADDPSAAAVATLAPDRSPPDEFTVRGREIYLHCPNGVAKTKLTNDYFDSRLTTTSTMRNWNTVIKLLELSGGS